jgi:hypothetical protein
MQVIAKLLSFVAVAVTISLSVVLAANSGADPSDDPCPLAMALLCRLVPTAPDFNGDVDLTTLQPSVVPPVSEPGVPLPIDICSNGCI